MKTEPYYIDINVDLGEGMNNDQQVMPLVSSCNIACGGHYGNLQTIKTALRLAKKHQIKVGAHPSFPDTINFGRKLIILSKSELFDTILTQLNTFIEACLSEGIEIHHVKLHGALYNYAAKDESTADTVIDAIIATKLRPILYAPPNSILAEKAKKHLPLWFEAFIDRRYHDNGALVPRTEDGALITNANIAWRQLEELVTKQTVTTIEGDKFKLNANTFCVHGDTPNAIKILLNIYNNMPKHSIHLA